MFTFSACNPLDHNALADFASRVRLPFEGYMAEIEQNV